MVPYAAKHNLRLVLLNMRDYPGSSGYRPDELEALSTQDVDIQAAAIKQQGVHLAAFLTHLIKNYDIQNKSISSKGTVVGGLAVLAWSLGNVVTHSFLSHANDYSPDVKRLLDQYLRTMVFYGAFSAIYTCSCANVYMYAAVAATGIGQLPLPPQSPQTAAPKGQTQRIYSPLRDPNLSHSERLTLFSTWVTSYYPPISDLSEITPEGIDARKALHLADSPFYDPEKKPSVEHMSPLQLSSVTDFDALERSSGHLTRINSAVYLRNFQRAHWFDDSTEPEERVWPQLKVLVVWCDMDMVDCIWAASRFSERLKDLSRGNKGVVRNIEIAKFEGGNHFVSHPILPPFLLYLTTEQAHWDEPERFVEFLASRI